MARYFIGLLVPPSIQERLMSFTATMQATLPADQLSDLSWNHPEDLHCTLLYVGQTDEEGHLVREMHRVAAPLEPVTITISGTTHWLGRNSLALAVTGAERAGTRFVAELGHLSADQRVERRPFYGHVTLGRVRPVPDPKDDIFAGHRVEPLTWTATSVHLVKNREEKTAPRYESVSQAPLGG